MTLWAGEYYNVSRHEDLPLLFTENIQKSMRFYYDAGARGITYMHTPIVNWGVRVITQNLHARLAWDIGLDVKAFCRKVRQLRYGHFAGTAERVYDEIEKASRDIAEWRAWRQSILNRFEEFCWEGKADKSLARRHYRSSADAIAGGRRIVDHYHRAAQLTREMLEAVRAEVPAAPRQAIAVNPEEQSRNRVALRTLRLLETELRALNYAEDVMSLMTGCAEVYDAVRKKDFKKVRELYAELEKQADRMSLYTMDLSYRAHVPHFETRTALERSQCETLIRMLKPLCR